MKFLLVLSFLFPTSSQFEFSSAILSLFSFLELTTFYSSVLFSWNIFMHYLSYLNMLIIILLNFFFWPSKSFHYMGAIIRGLPVIYGTGILSECFRGFCAGPSVSVASLSVDCSFFLMCVLF